MATAARDPRMTTPIYQVKAEFFRTLGHPARIRVLEILQEGERPVSELIPEVGIEPSHLSQQLGVMRRAGIIQSRKVGSNVYYSVGDPKFFELLDVAKRIITSSLAESQLLLEQMEASVVSGPSEGKPRRSTQRNARPDRSKR
jgi:DNA-binding transcriptional ArsR family regulator